MIILFIYLNSPHLFNGTPVGQYLGEEHFTHAQLDMTTIYKQTKHIFTLTNNIMFDLLVFTRMLEIYKCIKEIKENI
jgi:hypothetical protein